MMAFQVREVREVTMLSACNHLREVTAGGAREVREVNAQVIDIVAGGNSDFAAARALYPTDIQAPPFGAAGLFQSVHTSARFHGGGL